MKSLESRIARLERILARTNDYFMEVINIATDVMSEIDGPYRVEIAVGPHYLGEGAAVVLNISEPEDSDGLEDPGLYFTIVKYKPNFIGLYVDSSPSYKKPGGKSMVKFVSTESLVEFILNRMDSH